MLSARKQLDVITAYRQVGTYRGAAEMCGVTHKTVKRITEKDEAAFERASLQAAECPLMDRGAQVAIVGQAAGDDEIALAGASGHGGLSRVALQGVRRRELLDMVADLARDPGGKTITQARHAQLDLAAREGVPRVGVLDGADRRGPVEGTGLSAYYSCMSRVDGERPAVTLREAADELGLKPQRINQLLTEGALTGPAYPVHPRPERHGCGACRRMECPRFPGQGRWGDSDHAAGSLSRRDLATSPVGAAAG